MRIPLLGRVAAALSALALLVPATGVQAAEKPIRIVIYAAGGPVDFVARQVADELAKVLGAPVIVDTRPGANGIIAAQNVASSEPDGTSLLFSSSGLFTISPTLQKLPYDPDRDFVPIGRAVVPASAIAIDANLPARTLPEFIDYVKAAKPGEVVFGTPGVGNVTQLWIEELNAAADVQIRTVAYKGIAPAITDILGGRVAGTMADMPAFLELRKAGKLRVIGLVGNERSPAAPDVPTIKEQGYPGVDTLSWYGFFAPARTPAATVTRLNQALAKVLAAPQVQQNLRAMGMEPSPTTPQEFGRIVQTDRAALAKIIESKHITVQ